MDSPVQNILAVAGRVRVRSGYLRMFDLLEGLAERGYNLTLLCTSLPREMDSSKYPFPILTWGSFARRWHGMVARETLREFSRRRRIQVIHVHGTGLGAVAHRFLRVVEAPMVFTPFAAVLSTREKRKIQRRAGRVIALSEYMREGLVNHCRVPQEKLRVILPGIAVRRYDFLPPQISGRLPVVGTAAPLEPGRGQNDFLQAVKRLLDAGLDAEFVVAGDGPAEPELRGLARELGIEKRVAFVTGLSDYRGVISAVDVFVRPAITGGLGYTVLEGMAMGKVVIATATGDVPELIADGKTGIIVPKNDAESLAREIRRVLEQSDRAREIGAAARAGVAERFGMERLVERTVAVYSEVAAQAFPSEE